MYERVRNHKINEIKQCYGVVSYRTVMHLAKIYCQGILIFNVIHVLFMDKESIRSAEMEFLKLPETTGWRTSALSW